MAAETKPTAPRDPAGFLRYLADELEGRAQAVPEVNGGASQAVRVPFRLVELRQLTAYLRRIARLSSPTPGPDRGRP